MPIQYTISLACFPVITINLASLVSCYQELTIIAEIEGTSIACTVVAGELFSSDSSEIASFVLVYHNLVVRRLASKVLS